jgi:stringent starvation protein A
VIQGLGEVLVFGRADGELKEKLLAAAKQQTETVQVWLEERLEGPWFCGEEFSWADLCVAPMVNRSVTYGFGPKDGSKLKEWHARLKERESVKETFAEYEKGLEGMRSPEIKEAYLSGKRKREYRDVRLEWMVKSGGLEVVKEGMEKGNIRFGWP